MNFLFLYSLGSRRVTNSASKPAPLIALLPIVKFFSTIGIFPLHLRANYRSLKSLRTYSIPFTGLKLGKHHFDYVITNAFFDEFEYSLVKKARPEMQC